MNLGRLRLPSLKVRENMSAHKAEVEAFWKSVENVQDVKPEDHESRTQLINSAYETVRRVLCDVVPSDIRMASDRALQLLKRKDETVAKSLADDNERLSHTSGISHSSRQSRRSRLTSRSAGSTETVKAQIQAEKVALEVEKRAKLEEMEQIMRIRQCEEEERSRRAKHEFEMEMMKQKRTKVILMRVLKILTKRMRHLLQRRRLQQLRRRQLLPPRRRPAHRGRGR